MNEQLKDLETALQTLVDYKKVNGKVKFYQEQDGGPTMFTLSVKPNTTLMNPDLDTFIEMVLKHLGYGRED